MRDASSHPQENNMAEALLFEHEDGRYAVNPDTTGDPKWHRVGPVDVSALSTNAGEAAEPQCVIEMRQGEREPRMVSWNEFTVGTHCLYAHPPAAVHGQSASTEGATGKALQDVYMTLAEVPCKCSKKRREEGVHLTDCHLFHLTVAIDALADTHVLATPPAAIPAAPMTDEQILKLNAGEVFFSESPSRFPEAGHGTQYHAGAPGVLGFARAVLAQPAPVQPLKEQA
jgi:hypothetical protein